MFAQCFDDFFSFVPQWIVDDGVWCRVQTLEYFFSPFFLLCLIYPIQNGNHHRMEWDRNEEKLLAFFFGWERNQWWWRKWSEETRHIKWCARVLIFGCHVYECARIFFSFVFTKHTYTPVSNICTWLANVLYIILFSMFLWWPYSYYKLPFSVPMYIYRLPFIIIIIIWWC